MIDQSRKLLAARLNWLGVWWTSHVNSQKFERPSQDNDSPSSNYRFTSEPLKSKRILIQENVIQSY